MAKVLTAGAIRKFKPAKKRRVIRDGGSRSLYLVIQPSGAKSWMMRFRSGPNGKAAKMVIGPVDLSGAEVSGEPTVGMPLTLSAARQVAAQVHRERVRGADVVAEYKVRRERRRAEVADRGASSFAALARQYVEEHAKPKVRGWRELARSLGLDPDADLEPISGGIAQRWADRDAKSIDGHDVHAAVDEARRIGTPGIEPRRDGASEARARSFHAALSACFGWMLRHRRIDVNPCAGVWRPRPPAARDRVLTSAEIVKFWKATDAVNGAFGAVLKLLLLTGQRLNEIAELRWDELSEDRVEMRLPGSRTKNHRAHTVPLAPLAREIVARIPRIDGCAFVFTTNGRTPISGWSKVKMQLDAEMKIPPWRLHDLRRTCVTEMAELGIPPHLIELIVNHVSGARAGVAGTYNRSEMMAERRAALERWASHVAGLVAERPANVAPIRRSRV
jgi:integrase